MKKRALCAAVMAAIAVGVVMVAVAQGRFVLVDIADYATNDGISMDANPGDQAFDGAGWGYPGDELPNGDFVVGGPSGAEVPFKALITEDGMPNNIECAGDVVSVPASQYHRVYFLTSSHHGATENARIVFTYADNSITEGYVNAGDWCGNRLKDELEVMKVSHRHDKNGDTGPPARLWLNPAILLDASKILVSITFPDANKLHVFGITLEQ